MLQKIIIVLLICALPGVGLGRDHDRSSHRHEDHNRSHHKNDDHGRRHDGRDHRDGNYPHHGDFDQDARHRGNYAYKKDHDRSHHKNYDRDRSGHDHAHYYYNGLSVRTYNVMLQPLPRVCRYVYDHFDIYNRYTHTTYVNRPCR